MSVLSIKVDNFELSNIDTKENFIKDYNFKISILFLNVIPIFKTSINKNRLVKIKEKFWFNKLRKNLKMDFGKDFKLSVFNKEIDLNTKNILFLKYVNPRIKKLDLDMGIGTEDAVITSFLVTIISIAFSIFLTRTVKKYSQKKIVYKILPKYINKNVIDVKLETNISFRLVNLLNVLYLFSKQIKKKDIVDLENYSYNSLKKA
jgi:hypothetical protein